MGMIGYILLCILIFFLVITILTARISELIKSLHTIISSIVEIYGNLY